ncbi:exo-beta-N-acetylmuramidase NamZ domain-containing protein [Streptomyces murinus]|uniref:exo-beta-N-acetylmuramidase NamZ domain-containing protein n=1 Tax=Streptomyces murinus TaxID=33900 RepID=UPI002E1082C2|nr:exo-beta-N-acetylmuramidase NamZ domain-containing protein [Streptomyces murinus]WSI88032.1 DUF1343 domain-containing protein [Streptomyces murinus]
MSADGQGVVETGIARLCAAPALAGGGRVGLVGNHTTVPHPRSAAGALASAGLRLVALFGSEHGVHGSGQTSEDGGAGRAIGLPVYKTHRCDGERLGELPADSGVDVLVYGLQDVDATGRRRAVEAEGSGLPWIAPSPNTPTPATAAVCPGTCLFEGTNLSEDRGTTQPFEIVGAPCLDARFAPALDELALPGAHFRDPRYAPTFHKHTGQPLCGVRLHVTDRTASRPVRTAVAMPATLRRLTRTASPGTPVTASTSSTFLAAPTGSGTPSTRARARCRCATRPRHRPRRPVTTYCCAPVPTRQEGRIRR